jgi:hypothetical protein
MRNLINTKATIYGVEYRQINNKHFVAQNTCDRVELVNCSTGWVILHRADGIENAVGPFCCKDAAARQIASFCPFGVNLPREPDNHMRESWERCGSPAVMRLPSGEWL